MRGHGPEEALRFAARIVAAPADAVGRWRALTGGKAVGCIPPVPVPEILHSAGLLPVPWGLPGIPRALRSRIDAWVVPPAGPVFQGPVEGNPRFEFPTTPPVDLAAALDLLESLAEWAGVLSGRSVTEGALWKSIRAYRERKDLVLLLIKTTGGRAGGFPPGGKAGDLSRAGDYLPPEAHSMLLAQSLQVSYPTSPSYWEGERDDPLLRLARRWIAGNGVDPRFPAQNLE